MKQLLKNALWGLLLFVCVMVAEFLVTLPFTPREGVPTDLTLEFGLTAPLAFGVSWGLARFLRTTRAQANSRGFVWAIIVLALYVLIGLGNGTLALFAVWTFLLLVSAILLGPVVAGRMSDGRPTARRSAGRTTA